MSKIVEVFPELPEDSRTFEEASPRELVLSKCRIGLEMEVEGTKKFLDAYSKSMAKRPELWSMTDDGSLKDFGKEFTLTNPLFGKDLITSIHQFCTFASNFGFSISKRTGLHVHVDVRNCDVEQIGAMLFVYAVLERPLFRYAGMERAKNHFCVPWYAAPANLTSLYPFLLGGQTNKDLRSATLAQEKYAALNLLPMSKYGSIEFRHMQTTFDPNKIVEWVNILMCIKRFGNAYYKSGASAIGKLPIVFSQGPLTFAADVLGDYSWLLDYNGVEADLRAGMETALPLTVNYKKAFAQLASAAARDVIMRGAEWQKPDLVKETPKKMQDIPHLSGWVTANQTGIHPFFGSGPGAFVQGAHDPAVTPVDIPPDEMPDDFDEENL